MANATIAIAGNPNCGKTTLFNALTGSSQRVGNWPGVTVERIEGQYQHDGKSVKVVDLPGIYSFSAYSIDETIASRYILDERPAVVVNIVDATNLERNLFLTTQLLEMKVPIVVALNMMDLARQRKLSIEIEHLAQHLDCPVVAMVASKDQGLSELKAVIAAVAAVGAKRSISQARVVYDEEVEEAIEVVRPMVAELAERQHVDDRWLAIKLLEQDQHAAELADQPLKALVAAETERIERHTGEDIDIVIADGRYGFIHGLARDVLRGEQVRALLSDALDRVILNRLLGIPIFLLMMYLVFVVTVNVSSPFIDFFDILGGTICVDGFRALLQAGSVPELLITILADGAGDGIRIVATFIPPIFFIFLCLSILEDSGYMSRAAFVMDRLLRGIGLPGKAFLPMLVGFGCSVPAVMAARTLENERDRIVTIMITPFMSCGARLPVYALFAVAFFPKGGGGTLIFGLYITGIMLGILTGLMLKRTVLQGEAATFVMELPPYHLPTFGGIMHHTWNKLKGFIGRAGKVIVTMVIILSLLNAIGTDGSFGKNGGRNSILSAIGRTITPVFAPMGISDENWPATVGLFTGAFAKEAVVGTLDSLYAQIDAADHQDDAAEPFDFWAGVGASFAAIRDGFAGFYDTLVDPTGLGAVELADATAAAELIEVDQSTFGTMHRYFGGPIAAIAYLLFVLTYAPCVAAITAILRETNLRWTIFSVLYMTGLAWVVATVFYQLATIFQHPGQSVLWLAVSAAIVVTFHISVTTKARAMLRA